MNKGVCPNCLTEQTWPDDQETHCMSDAEWDAYIEGLVDAHKNGACVESTCGQCQQPGDPLEHWLS